MSMARGSEPPTNRCIASTNSPDLLAASHDPAQAPADVPMIRLARPRSSPSSARPLARPAYHAAPMGPPPPSTNPNGVLSSLPRSPRIRFQYLLGLPEFQLGCLVDAVQPSIAHSRQR